MIYLHMARSTLWTIFGESVNYMYLDPVIYSPLNHCGTNHYAQAYMVVKQFTWHELLHIPNMEMQ